MDIKFNLNLLSRLVKIIPYVLGTYFVLRMGELFITGKYMLPAERRLACGDVHC